MAENTKIEWATHTFNPWTGCTKVSPACDHCYAEEMMDTRFGRVQWGGPGKGVGTRARTSAANWRKPLKWNRKAEATGTRPFVFCASLADVFDNQVPLEWRGDLFDLIHHTPHLLWLLLTKRPQNIVAMVHEAYGNLLPRNVAIGTTIEDQARADLNVPHLLRAKAELNPAFAFLSCEPLLGPVHLNRIEVASGWHDVLAGWRKCDDYPGRDEVIDWVICGGESGRHARPMHPDWARSLRDQCADAGVPFLFKQWGEWIPWEWGSPPDMRSQAGGWMDANCVPQDEVGELVSGWSDDCLYCGDHGCIHQRVGKHRSGRLLDGAEHNGFPEVLHA